MSAQCWRLDSSSVGDSLDVLLRSAGEGETVHVCELTNHSSAASGMDSWNELIVASGHMSTICDRFNNIA